MRKTCATLFAFLVCGSVASQDLLECLSPAVLHGIARNPMIGVGDAVVTGSMPPVMVDVSVPDDFDFIASAVGDPETTVAFRSELANDVALDRALGLLESDGWEMQGSNRTNVYFEGDANSPRPSFTGSVCRDGQRMTVGSRDIEGLSYINYHIYGDSQLTACGNQASPLLRGISAFGASSQLDRYVPLLQFPVDPATGRAVVARPTSSGSSGNSRFSTTQVAVAMPIAELSDFLGAQLLAAGWSPDSAWQGNVSAGSTWTRQPDSDGELMAMLEILLLPEAVAEVSFRITQLN